MKVKNTGFAMHTPADVTFTNNIGVATVTPSSGSIAGGQILTIVGSNFGNNADKVNTSIGGSSCEVLTVNMSCITCRTSPNSQGTFPVVVSVGNVSSSDSASSRKKRNVPTASFSFVSSAATVSAVSPVEGSVAGGETLVLTGSGFKDARVKIGAADCAITSITETRIECKVSPNPQGVVKVAVFIPGQGNADGEVTYRFVLKVTSFIPREGSVQGGTRITISGSGFSTNPTANKLLIGSKLAKVLSSTASQIVAETPNNFKVVNVDNSGAHEGKKQRCIQSMNNFCYC